MKYDVYKVPKAFCRAREKSASPWRSTTTAVRWPCRQGHIIKMPLLHTGDRTQLWDADKQVSAIDLIFKCYFDNKQRMMSSYFFPSPYLLDRLASLTSPPWTYKCLNTVVSTHYANNIRLIVVFLFSPIPAATDIVANPIRRHPSGGLLGYLSILLLPPWPIYHLSIIATTCAANNTWLVVIFFHRGRRRRSESPSSGTIAAAALLRKAAHFMQRKQKKR